MQRKRAIFSFILFLIYGAGLAHNLIPHCEEVDHIAHDSSHQHETHVHDNGYGSDVHADIDFYEFLVCLFADVEHYDHKELDENYSTSIADFKVVDVFKVKFVQAWLSVIAVPEEKQDTLTSLCSEHSFYDPPHLVSHKLRGPPTLS